MKEIEDCAILGRQHYSQQFDRAMKDFEAAVSRGDFMTAANSFMTATSTNNLLKDIESYEC